MRRALVPARAPHCRLPYSTLLNGSPAPCSPPGTYEEVAEGDFLGIVTSTERVVCHFFHREFERCRIMDK